MVTFFTELRDDTDGELVTTFVFDRDRTEIIQGIPKFIGEFLLDFVILLLSHIQLYFIIIRILILQLFYIRSLCLTLLHHSLYLKALAPL